MSEVFENLSEVEQQRLLDRLVDGEIDHDEQRRLILSLEAQPDGWRRCALAFLEAQTWGREFQQLAIANSRTVCPPLSIATQTPRRAAAWLKPLAVAAALALAFTLGVAVRRTSEPAAMEIASSRDENSTTVDPHNQPFETLKVSLPSDDDQAERTLEVPLFEADQKSLDSLLADEQPVLSDVELKTLESTGHLVEQRRAYYPVQLQDGRRGVLPMDLVEVKYTGGWQ